MVVVDSFLWSSPVYKLDRSSGKSGLPSNWDLQDRSVCGKVDAVEGLGCDVSLSIDLGLLNVWDLFLMVIVIEYGVPFMSFVLLLSNPYHLSWFKDGHCTRNISTYIWLDLTTSLVRSPRKSQHFPNIPVCRAPTW